MTNTIDDVIDFVQSYHIPEVSVEDVVTWYCRTFPEAVPPDVMEAAIKRARDIDEKY